MAAVSRSTTATVRFVAEVSSIDGTTIVRLPEQASAELPSRGQVAVQGTVDGREVATVVEPDGRRGHWLKIEDGQQPGDTVTVELEVRPDWPEPTVPADLSQALAAAPQEIRETWDDITPMARWEWVRWVGATANPATRQRRVEVSIDKMAHGKRRPCCFDLSSCTDPTVSRSGKLRDPA